MLCFFGAKGGVGCSVVAASAALWSARSRPTLLVDLGGDGPAIIGASLDAGSPGLREWLESADSLPDALARLEHRVVDGLSLLPAGAGAGSVPEGRLRLLGRLLADDSRQVVVDCGLANEALPLMESASSTVLVTRACYLALRRAVDLPRPDGVVLVAEHGRALRDSDVANALGCEDLVRVSCEPEVARAVDAGLLAARMPRALRPLEGLL